MANTVRILITAKDEISGELDKIRDKAVTLSKTDIGKGMLQGAGIAAFSAMKGVAMGALDAVTDFAAGSVKAASDQREAMALTSQVFEDQTDSVERWAKSSKDAFTATEAMQFASNFGTAFKNVGMSLDETTAKAKEMTTLAGDLGSAFNTSSSEAATALRSGLLGESEPLRRFGVFLDEAKVKAKAAAMGLAPLGAALTDGEKVAARYALIMEQTADSQGMFGRDTESLADKAKLLQSNLSDLQVELGTKLTPALLTVTEDAVTLMSVLDSDAPLTFAERVKESTDVLADVQRLFSGMGPSLGLWESAMADSAEATAKAAAESAMAYDTGSERVGMSLDDMQAAMKDTAGASDKTKDAIVRDNKSISRSYTNLADIALDGYSDNFDRAMDIVEARADLHAAKNDEDRAQAYEDLAKAGALSADGYKKWAATLERLASKSKGEVKDSYLAALAYIRKLQGLADDPITVTVNLRTNSQGNIGAKAAGGPISPYGTALVGENGPEIIRLGSSGGQVMPSIAGASGGGSAPVVNINVSTPVMTPGAAQALADAIGPALTRWQQARGL